MNPVLSVIMPVYNNEDYLDMSINSILNQSFKNFEFIIVNDGSNLNTRRILNYYKKKDKRIILINQKNKGLTVSLNRAIKISRGSIIARQDADDISHKERFAKQINVFRNNKNIVLCGTFAYLINEKNDIIKLVTNLPIKDNKIKNQLIYQNCFIHSSTMYSSSIIKKIGLYNKSYKYAQDYECWSRMIPEGIFLNIPKKLISIRVHNNSITFKNVKEQTYSAIQIALNNYRKILKKNKCEIDSLKKVFYFLNAKNLNKKLKINFFDLNLKEIFILIRFPKKLLKVILLKFF